jgi:hypothetical protein
MRLLRAFLILMLPALALGCYSHTREVVVEQVPTASCKQMVWVPPQPGVEGHWRCTM